PKPTTKKHRRWSRETRWNSDSAGGDEFQPTPKGLDGGAAVRG
ncbi:hypothetical protein A2U01_0073184, partial [Trifolium medium]|nr:hypothetical protein [Trifolium medium]